MLQERESFETYFANEDDLKMKLMSVNIDTPKINPCIRDKSCIITFPKGSSENRLNRKVVEDIMRREWGDLFDHVRSYGNVDFSQKWVFCFDTVENNDLAFAKEVFINNKRVNASHATRKFHILKVDWVSVWTELDDLAQIITKVPGVTGKYVDSRWGRGDLVNKDSTQVILRFYKDPSNEFEPPQYVHYFDEYGSRVFLHLTVLGQTSKCMKCDEEGHTIASCTKQFCKKCGKLVDREGHICMVKRANDFYKWTRREITSTRDEPGNKENIGPLSSPSRNKDKASWSEVSKFNTISSKSKNREDEYIGNKVILTKGSGKIDRTPPTPQHPSPKSNRRQASFGNVEEVKNKINFSTPVKDMVKFTELPAKLSPISDEGNYPPLPNKEICKDSKSPIINIVSPGNTCTIYKSPVKYSSSPGKIVEREELDEKSKVEVTERSLEVPDNNSKESILSPETSESSTLIRSDSSILEFDPLIDKKNNEEEKDRNFFSGFHSNPEGLWK